MAIRRVNGRWRVDWRDEFGIRRRKFFDLKADAENFEDEQRRKTRESKTGAPPACHPDVTFTEYARGWLNNRGAQGIDPGTVERQEIDLRRHLLPRFGSTKVREIYRPAVKALLLSKLSDGESGQGLRPGREEKRTRKKLARGSVKNIYHTLSAILSEAVEDRLIVANPIRGLWKRLNKGTKTGKSAVRVKALDTDQAQRFLVAALKSEPEHYAFFCSLMWAGLRVGEGFALRPERIDARGRTLLIDAQVGQHGGLKATKTGEERSVDLSRRLAVVLDRAVSERQQARPKVIALAGHEQGATVGGRAEGPWLFYPDLGPSPSEKDTQRVYKRALNGMRRALRKAGLPDYFSLHSLRHTFGSGLISRGVSPAYVQKQMGHASIQQTVDTYGSWLPVRVPGAVDALANATAPSGGGHHLDTERGFETMEAR